MDDELVLLTSYFNLANGRRQDTADTFRVDPSLPSNTSPDGTAALYVVTEASTGGHMGPRARRMAADTIAWEYSRNGDEPPARRLKAAMRAAHSEVAREFDGHVSVGVSVIAVERDDIFLAQVAPGQVYVVHEGSLHSISANVGGSSPYSRGLGSGEGPDISLFRDAVAPGDVIALCSSWFHRAADPEELRECFAAGSADDIAECMLELAQEHDVRDATVVVIEAELASQLESAPREPRQGLMEQVDMAVQALADVGRMLVNELRPGGDAAGDGRTRLTEQEVAAGVAASYAGTSAGAVEEPLTGGAYEELVPEPEPETERTAAWDLGQLAAREARSSDSTLRDQATDEVPPIEAEAPAVPADEEEAVPPRRQRSELEEVNTRIQYELDMADVIPPVQAFPDTSTEPSRIYATSKDIQAVNRRPRRFGGVNRPSAEGAPVLRPGLADIDLRPGGRPAPPAVVWVSLAAIAVVAVLAIFIFLRNHQNNVATPPYLTYVQQDLKLASAATSPAVQDSYLAKAKRNINLAVQVGAPAASVRQWRNRLQTTTNTLYHINPAYSPTLLANFTQGTEIATSADNLYVLDKSKNGAFSVPGSPSSSPIEVVAGGETDSAITVAKVSQLATSGTTVLVLDSNNTLVRDSAGTKTAVALGKVTPTQSTAGMANFGNDVYLLDPPGNQIWKYTGVVTNYNTQPSGFFAPNAANIHNAVAFTLDDKNVYVLLSSGKVLKFDMQGNAQPFAATPRIPFVRPDAIFTDVGLSDVWIADPGSGQIVQIDKSGHYVRAYTSGSQKLDLSKVKGIAVPTSDKWLYVLTGNQVYRLTVRP